MEINTIITLKNGDNYLLTQQTKYQDANYYLAVACTEKGEMQKKYGVIK